MEVTNSYFANGICSGLHFVPFNQTSKQMNNYQILIKKDRNKFSFYVGVMESESFSISNCFQGLNELYLQFVNEDYLFFNYTDIPNINDEERYYFGNSINRKTANSIHKSEFVTKEDRIQYRQKTFTIQLPDNEVKIELKNSLGELVVSEIVNGNIDRNYFFNLKHCFDGLYQLWINNKLLQTFFITDELLNKDCIGIIKLDMDSIITKDDSQSEYKINFNARSVYWQYQIVIPKSRKIKVAEMKVIGLDNEEYIGPIEQEVIGGQISQVYTSAKAVQLQNKLEINPQLKVTYSNNFSNRKNQLDIKLPNPNAEQIRKYGQGEGEESFCSSTIVYV